MSTWERALHSHLSSPENEKAKLNGPVSRMYQRKQAGRRCRSKDHSWRHRTLSFSPRVQSQPARGIGGYALTSPPPSNKLKLTSSRFSVPLSSSVTV
ncbi:hypothetical protein D5086_025294 [Populus alba]|uniref:Uncharacterized protein n=1 Tax=Populus alba TaxID=43335 RepID=A0ACC4AYR2_POPAL